MASFGFLFLFNLLGRFVVCIACFHPAIVLYHFYLSSVHCSLDNPPIVTTHTNGSKY